MIQLSITFVPRTASGGSGEIRWMGFTLSWKKLKVVTWTQVLSNKPGLNVMNEKMLKDTNMMIQRRKHSSKDFLFYCYIQTHIFNISKSVFKSPFSFKLSKCLILSYCHISQSWMVISWHFGHSALHKMFSALVKCSFKWKYSTFHWSSFSIG